MSRPAGVWQEGGVTEAYCSRTGWLTAEFCINQDWFGGKSSNKLLRVVFRWRRLPYMMTWVVDLPKNRTCGFLPQTLLKSEPLPCAESPPPLTPALFRKCLATDKVGHEWTWRCPLLPDTHLRSALPPCTLSRRLFCRWRSGREGLGSETWSHEQGLCPGKHTERCHKWIPEHSDNILSAQHCVNTKLIKVGPRTGKGKERWFWREFPGESLMDESESGMRMTIYEATPNIWEKSLIEKTWEQLGS